MIANYQYAVCNTHNAEMREYTARYQIVGVDRRQAAVSIILGATGLPQLGQVYSTPFETDAFAVAYKYSSIQPEDWNSSREVWTVNVHYTTDSRKQRRPAANQDNPIDKPPMFSIGGHRRRVPAHVVREFDQNGNRVVNAANGKFPDNETMVDDSSNVLQITKNYASINLSQLDDYRDSVNTAAWMGKPARHWKMDPARARLVYWGNTPYWEVSYSFQANPETWDLKPLNLGKFDVNGEMKVAGGVTHSGFNMLNPDGEFFEFIETQIRFDGQAGNPDPFRWYKERDFTQLGLPSTAPATT